MQQCSKAPTLRFALQSWRSLVLFLTITFGVALIGGLITEPALKDWFVDLEKPEFMPPPMAFAIAWSLLYPAMAFALWRICLQRKKCNVKTAVLLYHIQLVLNLFWTVAFFGMHNPLLALCDIAVLQLFNIATAVSFSKIDKIGGALFVPYILWVSFASILNFFIWIANS